MANNYTGVDSTGTAQTFKSTDNADVHTPHKIVDEIVGVSAAGQAAMANSLPVAIASDQDAVPVSLSPQTSGGYSVFRSIDLDESEEEVKGAAGQVFGWYLFNESAATLYLKLYNDTAANVVVGTTAPKMTVAVPAGAGANVEFQGGIEFDTAITAAVTTGVADSDTGAPGANEFIANILYK